MWHRCAACNRPCDLTRVIPVDQLDEIRCSKCSGFLDTGFECNDCGHDMLPEIEQTHPAALPAPDGTQ